MVCLLQATSSVHYNTTQDFASRGQEETRHNVAPPYSGNVIIPQKTGNYRKTALNDVRFSISWAQNNYCT